MVVITKGGCWKIIGLYLYVVISNIRGEVEGDIL